MAKRVQETKKIKIAVCIPCKGGIPPQFLTALLDIVRVNMGRYVLHVMPNDNSPLDKARNELVQAALKLNADAILFLDSDNLVPPDIISRFLRIMYKEKADLVTGIYVQKVPPYSPVIREWRNGKYWASDDIELNKVQQIDGCGMGCALIKTEVFRKMDWPWFKYNWETWGEKHLQLSEDLYLCRSMMEKGMKMVCDSGLFSAHVGSTANAEEFMAYKQIRTDMHKDRLDLIDQISEFTALPKAKTEENIMMGQELIRKEWVEKNPTKWAQMLEFYKNTFNYLYDLANWHLTTRRKFDIEQTEDIKALKPKNVLDFGAGIGMNATMLAEEGIDITIADLDSETLNFARFRMQKKGLKFKEWKTDVDDMPPDKKYDVILAYDVLEHLPKQILKKYVDKLIQLKHKETKVKMTVSYGKSDSHPMHENMDEEIKDILKRLMTEY